MERMKEDYLASKDIEGFEEDLEARFLLLASDTGKLKPATTRMRHAEDQFRKLVSYY